MGRQAGTDLEFGGVPGAAAMLLGLPATVYGLNLLCDKESCSLDLTRLFNREIPSLWDYRAIVIVSFWLLFQALMYYLPSSLAYGLPLKSGKKLAYRCNAWSAFLLSLCGFYFAWYVGVRVTLLYELFLPLVTATTVIAFVCSALLYAKSYTVPKTELAEGGDSGFFLYDFFIGRELNPRIGDFDLKFWCELRPGLIGWVMLDLSFCAQAYESYGYLPAPLALVTAFHMLYVADALWFEECILSTMDIIHDGFGFMLVFGDLVWVPFLYCLQARFLLEHPMHWSGWSLFAFTLLNLLGYTIFRKSNSQKNQFRKNPTAPSVSHVQTLETASGRKLMVSSWWGICRHPNYLGDLIMATSWSLPCGFSHLIPYFYPVYFLGLLIHRFERDSHQCKLKYGSDWDKYCKMVPYKIFPYVY